MHRCRREPELLAQCIENIWIGLKRQPLFAEKTVAYLAPGPFDSVNRRQAQGAALPRGSRTGAVWFGGVARAIACAHLLRQRAQTRVVHKSVVAPAENARRFGQGLGGAADGQRDGCLHRLDAHRRGPPRHVAQYRVNLLERLGRRVSCSVGSGLGVRAGKCCMTKGSKQKARSKEPCQRLGVRAAFRVQGSGFRVRSVWRQPGTGRRRC